MHEGIPVTFHIVARSYEAISIVLDIQNALDGPKSLGKSGCLIHGIHKVRLSHARIVELQLRRLLSKLGDLELLELFLLQRRLLCHLSLTAPTVSPTIV